jgi:uncharacterized HAD superfamily protein
MSKLFAIDLDGTLCREHCWTIDDCLKATPRLRMIDCVNSLYRREHHIVIWSSRREELRTATEYWLKKNGVCYHAIDLQHKLGADIYLDDKAISSLDERIACEQLGTYL